jgi:hypothetical protein
MRARRLRLGLTVAKAARGARLSSARWTQLELGFSKGNAGTVEARPLPLTAAYIAHVLEWDPVEAFALLGLDGVPVPEVREPSLEDQIARLPGSQRDSVKQLIRSLLNPHEPLPQKVS